MRDEDAQVTGFRRSAMTFLLAVLLFHPWPLLIGYWFGASMHLTFDILVNGEYATKRAVVFYVFAYRAGHRFSAHELMDRTPLQKEAGKRPVVEFFRWRPMAEPRRHEKTQVQVANSN